MARPGVSGMTFGLMWTFIVFFALWLIGLIVHWSTPVLIVLFGLFILFLLGFMASFMSEPSSDY